MGGLDVQKWYPAYGVAAVVAYVAAVIVGGILIPGYSHAYNTISELTASDAPFLLSVQLLFALYNLCLVLFGLGRWLSAGTQAKMRTAAMMLMVVGLLGLLMYFYPQDPRDATMTFQGKMHIALAGLMSPLTILLMVFAGLELRTAAATRRVGNYSCVSAVVTLLTGGLSAYGIAAQSAYVGIFERLTIGSFLQWILVISLVMFTYSKPAVQQQSKSARPA